MKSIFKKIIVSILELEARFIIKKYKPSIIAVTGSVGKTSTKDAIYSVLAQTCHVRKSEKSFNSEIGVPLTVLGCQNAWSDPVMWIKNILSGLELIVFKSKYPECLVLEIGADHPGDIGRVVKWLKTDIVVITKVSEVPVHVEFFPSVEAVLAEKLLLVKSLNKNGTLVLPADDKRLMDASKGFSQNILTFGIENQATVMASDIAFNTKVGTTFKLNNGGNSIPVTLPNVLGNQHIYPVISATAVGIARNVSLIKIIDSLNNHTPPKGRMNIVAGINDSVIIDDTYNSSPDALHEALKVLAGLECSGKRFAILGDMMELGKFSVEQHKKLGEQAVTSCDVFVTVGPRARQMSEKAIHFDSSVDAGEYVKSMIGNGDIVLVKGSQSIRLERAVKILLADASSAEKVLVRQEEEWLAKK